MTDAAGMRHVLAHRQDLGMALLLVHLTATAALAGLVWVVQLVVYPSFLLVGGGPSWPAFHAAHTRAVALAVGPPWAVQGGAVAALLVRDGPSPLLLLTGALAAGHRRRDRRGVGAPAHPAGRGVRRRGRPAARLDELAAHGGVDGRHGLRGGARRCRRS